MSPWRRLARRVAYENPWLTVWHDEVIRPDGAPGIYGVVHFANRAIGVLAIDDDDRVLLVGQHRYPLDAYSWEIPEGGGASHESALDAARRELAEETGYRAGSWRELGRAALSNSVTDELAVFFVATDLESGTASPEGTEELQTRWVPFGEALAMTLDGRISDALTMLAVQREALDRQTRTGTEARSMNGGEIPEGVEFERVWAIEAEFAPDGATRQGPVRHAHLARLARLMREGVVVVAGALGNVESAFIVVRAADEAAARDLAEHDVYWTSGTWSSIRIRPYGLVTLSDA